MLYKVCICFIHVFGIGALEYCMQTQPHASQLQSCLNILGLSGIVLMLICLEDCSLLMFRFPHSSLILTLPGVDQSS